MNETIRVFLEILAAAVHGWRAEINREIPTNEWQMLFHMAAIHKVLPLFFEATYAHPSLANEQALVAAMKQQVRQQVILQTIRTREFLELNNKLQSAGVKSLVVKGIVCRSLYPQPNHRPSSDEDVLIPEAQFEICHGVLTEFGMATKAEFNSYEVPYCKAGNPLYIELHKSLFPPESDAYGDMNRFFENVWERAVALDIQGLTVYTMCPTDHLFYLICHAFKHFLHSGFGIRQICDIVLFAHHYGADVDWTQILESCQAIRAEKFAAAIFAMGKNYLGFDAPAIWQGIEVDEAPMLRDLLDGGLYGGSSMSRKHSSNITLDAVAAQKKGKKAKSSLIISVFPPREQLEGRYPYLKKYAYLLPVAWCSRLWTYGKETRNTPDNNAGEALKIGTERVELLKMYGIIE